MPDKARPGVRISVIILFAAVILLFVNPLSAAQRRMLGPNFTSSWASSYLTVNSSSVTVQKDATWTYATASGWFFDYMLNPYISMRTQWFFYPDAINSDMSRFGDDIGKINIHEIGFSVLRHFGKGYVSPWFGAGPYIQFATIDTFNSYIFHILLSLGVDYEFSEDLFFCPEVMCGLGAGLFKNDESNVVIDVPTGNDFSTSGIVIFLKLGVAKAF